MNETTQLLLKNLILNLYYYETLKELAFLCKFIDKWIIATPLNIWDTKFFKVWGSIYSNALFKNENTWNLIDNTYKQLKEPYTKQDATIEIIRSITDWETIEL